MEDNDNSSLIGLLIVTILMIIGGCILYFSFISCGAKFTLESLINTYLYKHGIVVIFSLFFIGIGIYVWFNFIANTFVKPREDTLYLVKVRKNMIPASLNFIDKNGKKYEMMIDLTTNPDSSLAIEENSYYKVLKTKDYIKKIVSKTDEVFSLVPEKEPFFLTWYYPGGKISDIMLLPIVYVIFLPGFLSMLMAPGVSKIYGLIMCIVPGFLIGYDLVCKIRK